MLQPILFRMAGWASKYPLRQITATRHPLRRSFELPVGDGALSWAKKRTPANSESDPHDQSHEQYKQTDAENCSCPLHSVWPRGLDARKQTTKATDSPSYLFFLAFFAGIFFAGAFLAVAFLAGFAAGRFGAGFCAGLAIGAKALMGTAFFFGAGVATGGATGAATTAAAFPLPFVPSPFFPGITGAAAAA